MVLIRNGKNALEGKYNINKVSQMEIPNKDLILYEIKADKQPIGSFDNRKPFENHTIQLQKGDNVYMFSDGFIDQFGGEDAGTRKLGGKKFKSKPFKNLLLSIQNEDMDRQKEILDETIERWRGSLKQIDDICVFGVRI